MPRQGPIVPTLYVSLMVILECVLFGVMIGLAISEASEGWQQGVAYVWVMLLMFCMGYGLAGGWSWSEEEVPDGKG